MSADLPLFSPERLGRPIRPNSAPSDTNPEASRALTHVDASGPLRARFDGPVYSPGDDDFRLTAQIRRVFDAIKDGQPRTVREISALTGDPEPSVSAQLRHLRKPRFGGFEVRRQKRAGCKNVHEYRLVLNGEKQEPTPKQKPTPAELWRELLALRERVERLEQEKARQSSTVEVGP